MPASIAAGRVINNYRIVRQLGAGGMGAVYEVVHVQIGRRAAIKLLSLDPHSKPEFVTRFLNEAKAANQVKHPGVVQVFEYGQLDDGTPWMLMEYLDGKTLGDRMTAQGRLSLAATLPIIQQLAEILTIAHGQGIIHRDLKPSNVMLQTDRLVPGGERVKLLDFGIAKLLDQGPLQQGQPDVRTETGRILGTIHYMAPEQCKSAADVDGRADVYALGVMAFQALSGSLPIYDRESWGLIVKKVTEAPLQLGDQVPELPRDICELVMAMLEREPEKRPAMAAVEESLARMLGLGGSRPTGVPTPAPLASAGTAGPDDKTPPVAGPTATTAPSIIEPPSSSHAPTVDGFPVTSDSEFVPHVAHSAPQPVVRAQGAAAVVEEMPAVPTAPRRMPASPPMPTGAGESAANPPEDKRGRLRLVVALAGLASLVAVAVAASQHSAPKAPSYVSDLSVQTVAIQPAPDVGVRAQAIVDMSVAAAAPDLSVVAVAVKTSESTRSRGARSPACSMAALSETCIRGRALTAEIRAHVMAALRESHVKLCAHDKIVFSIGPSGVRLIEAPNRLSSAVAQDFLLILRGYLDIQPRLSQIEVRCGEP